MQVKNLRSILQKLERSPRLQTLLGVTYDELLPATDALERLPVLIPQSATE